MHNTCQIAETENQPNSQETTNTCKPHGETIADLLMLIIIILTIRRVITCAL